MQRTKLIVYPILATILLILVFQFVENKSRNISVEEYFYQNSDEFADIVDVLRQNKVEGFPLYLTSEDDIQTLFGDANQDVSAEAIRSVFKKTDCNAIYASTTEKPSLSSKTLAISRISKSSSTRRIVLCVDSPMIYHHFPSG